MYEDLKLELQAHAAAEERHLYVPVMQHDEGLDLSRHAITEHHEMDEMMETLDDGRIGQEKWDKTCADLIHKVRHHLEEEENEFFKQAKRSWIRICSSVLVLCTKLSMLSLSKPMQMINC